MTSITSLGLGSGLDLESLITQLVVAEGTPTATRLDQKEAEYQLELSALATFRQTLDSFRSALDKLRDADDFAQRVARSTNEALFTARAESEAVPTSYDIEVMRLATAHKLRSGPFAADDAIGTGTLTLSLGDGPDNRMAVQITDPEHATLADIRDAINADEDNPGIQASIVTGEDGAHLVLTSADTGASNTITVTASGGDGGLAALVYDPDNSITNLEEIEQAVDAQIAVDGILVQSASNQVSNAIDGVTLSLVAASESGETARLDVQHDTARTRAAIEEFVKAYNTLRSTLDSLTSYDAQNQVGGPLLGDSMVLMFEDQLRREIAAPADGVAGVLDSLVDLGLETNLETGDLEIDAEALDAALEESFDEIGALLAGEDGYAVRLYALAESYLEADGLIEVRTEGLEKSIEGIVEDREQLEAHLGAYEERLRAEFTALDALVAELTATSEFLSQQLALLPDPGTVAQA